jgi:hypothetical protein
MRGLLHSALFLLLLTAPNLFAAAPPDSLAEIRRQIEVLTEEIERLKLGEVDETAHRAVPGLGPAASKVYSLKKSGVSIAGYGEVVYENVASEGDNGTPATSKDKVDFLRNIIYVGYRFSDLVVFNSEIEFEHGSTGKGGEVSVELGYIDLLLSPRLNVRAGMVLAPVGIVNEKHEPPTFFGTLRPNVERIIIPSTWRMNGAGLYGEAFAGWHYRAYVVEGLKMASFSSSDGIRGGRQSGANAVAEDLAITGRLEYLGLEGASLGASFYSGNSGQGEKDSVGALIAARTNVVSVHAEYVWRGLELRGLYAQTTVGESDRVAGYQRWKSGATTAPVIGSRMSGWYLSAGYDVMPLFLPGTVHYLAPFILYETYDTHAAVPSGQTRSAANDRSTLAVGLTWKPHPNVAFKTDYRDNTNGSGTATDQWNLAVTYLF